MRKWNHTRVIDPRPILSGLAVALIALLLVVVIPYVVLPILGPSTTRDATGKIVDIFFNPLTYILEGDGAIGAEVGRGLVRREEILDSLEKLRAISVDYYATL